VSFVILAVTALLVVRRIGRDQARTAAPEFSQHSEELANQISARLINVPPDQLDAEIERVLEALGTRVQADRCTLALLDHHCGGIADLYRWTSPHTTPASAGLAALPHSVLAWIMQHLEQQPVLAVPDVTALPPETGAARAELQAQSVGALLALPLISAGTPIGFLGFDRETPDPAWTNPAIGPLHRIGEVLTNVLERRRVERALRSSESRLQTILDSVQTGIVTIDAVSHRIVDANPAALQMLGAPRDQVIGTVCHRFICPADAGCCPITDLGQTVDNSERILLTGDGRQIPVLKTVASVTLEGHRHLVESFVNIAERKQTETELVYQSSHDALTGLYNRRHWEEARVLMARAGQFPISIVVADVDGLKRTNDYWGHDTGDRLLRETSSILKAGFRSNDIVARIGGDEFGVLLPGTPAHIAQQAVDRVRLNLMHHNAEAQDFLSVSFGIATATICVSLDEAFKAADREMYQEKLAKADLRSQ
jgi:diguanylate cyclase (GGDEF)-like protein/PAS domain S-box-containing protein